MSKPHNYNEIISSCPQSIKNSTKKTAPLFSLDGLTTPAKIYQIYDGDSAYMTILFNDKLTSFKIRLMHLDTPEMKSKDKCEKELAVLARDRVRELIDCKICCVVCSKFDLYGRVLVDIITPDGLDLATTLMLEKLAFPYEGAKKNKAWGVLKEERDTYLKQLQS